MAYAIAAVRAAVLQLLDDISSVRYTSAQIDQAARQALADYDTARPVIRTYFVTADGAQTFALPADFTALDIIKLRLYEPDDPDESTTLVFQAQQVDEQWIVTTPEVTVPADEILELTYAAANTVDGLDSASGTTIEDGNLFCLGVAGYAAQSRAISRAESINMQPAVSAQLLTLCNQYLSAFRAGLVRSQRATPARGAWDMPEVRF